MGGFAFLAMLATYGLVLYWYALNFERDEDGEDGLLGIRRTEVDPADLKSLKPGHVLIKRRGDLPRHGKVTSALEAVRAKAERIAAREPDRRG